MKVRFSQAYCAACRKPIGFTGQGAAYATEKGTWSCVKHTDPAWVKIVEKGRKRPPTRKY